MAKVVAVIGASSNRSKFGNRAVRAFRQQGYTVVPVNPHETEVEGLKCYRSVLDVPGPIDMASIYVPPEIGEQVIGEIAQKGIAEKILEFYAVCNFIRTRMYFNVHAQFQHSLTNIPFM